MNPFNLKNFLLCSIFLIVTGSGIAQKNWFFEVDGDTPQFPKLK